MEVPNLVANVHVFHAGTARDAAGRLVSAGGRVLSITAIGGAVREAAFLSRGAAEKVGLAGKQIRLDIGWREAASRGESG